MNSSLPYPCKFGETARGMVQTCSFLVQSNSQNTPVTKKVWPRHKSIISSVVVSHGHMCLCTFGKNPHTDSGVEYNLTENVL